MALPDFSSFLGTDEFVDQGLEKMFRKRNLNKGEHWIVPGKVCKHIAFISEGMFRAYVESVDTEQTRWAFLTGQYMTSLMSFGKQQAADEYIQAITDCTIYEISYTDWMELSQKYPPIQQAWSAMLLELYGCFESRVHSLLMGKAEDRYAYFMEKHPEFILHVPQKYVAEMLGIAPRHLSRIRAGLVE